MSSSQQIVRQALDLGFDAAGISGVDLEPEHSQALARWLSQNYHAGMSYMRETAADREQGARALLADCQSVVVVAQSYHEHRKAQSEAKIARYALGKDYHKVIRHRLVQLGKLLTSQHPQLQFRPCVDTAPLLERAYGQQAGLGWIGKNGMLLSRQLGSYTLLGCLLLDQALPVHAAFSKTAPQNCGTCTACMDACPTQALVEPGVLDARRCLSYWTIEHRGPFPPDTPAFDGWLFGCDRCQEVCPLNKKALCLSEQRLAARPQLTNLSQQHWQQLSQQDVERLIAGTAIKRAGVDGLRRNLAHLNRAHSPID